MSNTDFQEKLQQAIVTADNDPNKYIWKAKKDENGIQKEIKLMEASEEELKSFLAHCHTMLHNDDKKHPGKMVLLYRIIDQRKRCGVELFYRYEKEQGSSRFAIVDALKSKVLLEELTDEQIDELVLDNLLNTKSDYANLPYRLVIKGGINQLGIFDRSHITLNFILKQGIWFSSEEKKTYSEISSKSSEKLDYIKNQLKLPKEVRLRFDPVKGLTIKELSSILFLKTKKYEDMTLDQLTTLRYKVLFALEDQVNNQIRQWNDLTSKIKEVARLKEISL